MALPTLGKYELLEPLSSGGMADLFLARARGPAGIRKTVVVKRIKPELADDPRFVDLFLHEAQIGIQLHHPNIAQVYELGRAAGSWFIAMEFVDGHDLTKLLRRLGSMGLRLPVPLAVHVVAELVRGLHHAHTRTDPDGRPLGLVHRDVSPHNVLLSFDGAVKLVDFGIARIHPGDSQPEPMIRRGKSCYASPELLAGCALDHRTDLYAAGVVLWELLVGERPYADLSGPRRTEQIRAAGIPRLDQVLPDLAPGLVAIVARATAPVPDERQPSAAVLEEELRAWLYDQGHRPTAATLAEQLRRVFPEGPRLHLRVHMDGFARDLARMDADDPPSPRHLPGRLQPSPGERKQVAVLVIDVDGLAELSAQLEPERYLRRQFRLLRWIYRIVQGWGGVLQRAIDDHIFVLFGVPRTREDDLSRAMHCALEIQRRSGELAAKGLSVALCMGLHTGEVAVGIARRRVQYLARGDTTRLARQLASIADHGHILVSERVVAQMEAHFRVTSGPPVTRRGGHSPLPSYRLEGRRTGLVAHRRGPWLRRGPEIEQIQRAVEALQQGEGKALAIIGPVGSGKSRLVAEIGQLAQRRGVPFHRVDQPGWSAGHPFSPWVRAFFDLDHTLNPDESARRIREAAALGLPAHTLDILCWLAGATLPVSPDRAEWVEALTVLLRSMCRENGAILAVDIHGLDGPHQRILALLLRQLATEPLLVLLLSRPPLPESFVDLVEQVPLRPFDRSAQRRMLHALLDVDVLPDALLDLVAATSEGNPLYIQEIVKVLVDRGDLMVEGREARLRDGITLELPDSLHGLIASRIDALDLASKGVLQLASVIGPTFDATLLGRAAGLEDPSPLLLELEAAGLVVRAGSAWAFTTELVREAASRGIMGYQRRDYHRLVAASIETLYEGQIEPWIETLAHHWARGERRLDAARYALRAGERQERAGRLEAALDWYRRGLAWLASADDFEDRAARLRGEAMFNLKLGVLYVLLGSPDAGTRHLTLALDIAADGGMPWIEARSHLELGRRYLQEGRHRLATAHLDATAMLVDRVDDPSVELEMYEVRAALALDRNHTREAEDLWRRVLERAADDPVLSARCQSGLAALWLQAGQADRAEPMLRSALRAARLAEDRILEGRVLNNLGLIHVQSGSLDEALAFFRAALEVREGIGYTRGMVINHHNIGDVHFQRGDYAKAHVAFLRSYELATQADWARGQVLNEVYLIYLDARQGRAHPSQLDAVRERAKRLGDPTTAATALWLRGRLLLEADRLDEAERALHAALTEVRELGLGPVRGRVEKTLAHGLGRTRSCG